VGEERSVELQLRAFGLYVERLREMMQANPDRRALANQARWLP
jgi:hypothetical protein